MICKGIKMINEQFLNDILSQISVSGCEEELQQTIIEHMNEYADQIDTDEIGDTVCILNPNADYKVLITSSCR